VAINTFDQAKRVVKVVFGFTLLLVGIAMLVLPGPGIVTIGLALAVLSAEFVWARRLLERLKAGARDARDAIFPPARPDA
jgi:tellurite resistance protein TerC